MESKNNMSEKNYNMAHEEVFPKVVSILSEQFNVEGEGINRETDIIDDLNADSLDMVDLAEIIEDEFGMKIPDDSIESLRTVGGILDYITSSSN